MSSSSWGIIVLIPVQKASKMQTTNNTVVSYFPSHINLTLTWRRHEMESQRSCSWQWWIIHPSIHKVTINPWRLQRMIFYSLRNIRVIHCLLTDKCHYIHFINHVWVISMDICIFQNQRPLIHKKTAEDLKSWSSKTMFCKVYYCLWPNFSTLLLSPLLLSHKNSCNILIIDMTNRH